MFRMHYAIKEPGISGVKSAIYIALKEKQKGQVVPPPFFFTNIGIFFGNPKNICFYANLQGKIIPP
jgi:hypothetical protein